MGPTCSDREDSQGSCRAMGQRQDNGSRTVDTVETLFMDADGSLLSACTVAAFDSYVDEDTAGSQRNLWIGSLYDNGLVR
mmetsp:Transcript_8568/g.31654  ORF Transcript_8568/g.31654 Transcript_8568/m.31654 type:complete len:80 (+) Transcript_8568:1348-1587(+)